MCMQIRSISLGHCSDGKVMQSHVNTVTLPLSSASRLICVLLRYNAGACAGPEGIAQRK